MIRPASALGATVLSMLVATAVGADPADYLAEDAPDVVFSEAITEKAAELGNDPVRIYEFVRNELEYQSYYGLMKGPEATLRSGGGNEYDLAALLVSLLRVSGVPARFARGDILLTYDQASAWTGADLSADPLFSPPSDYWSTSQPVLWTFNSDAILHASVRFSSTQQKIEKLHVWVEAQVSLARYRGADPAQDPGTQKVWVPLDPSYKLREWNGDPGLPIGTDPALTFDPTGELTPTTGSPGYYETLEPRLPAELFEGQLRRYLAQDPVHRGKGVADVVFDGPVRIEAAGVLPNALPYELGSFDQPDPAPARRSANLVDLHTCGSLVAGTYLCATGLSPNQFAGQFGADDYRYGWRVHVCAGHVLDVDTCVTLPSTDSDKLLEFEDASAALSGKRVTLLFPPTFATAPNLHRDTYATCDSSVVVEPAIYVDGARNIAATDGSTPICSVVTVVVEVADPFADAGGVGIAATKSVHQKVVAAGAYTPAVDFHDWGAGVTGRAAEALDQVHAQLPLAETPGDLNGPFIDLVQNGVKDSQEAYLWSDFGAQEQLLGSLLHLARTRFFEIARGGDRELYRMHHKLPSFDPSVGLMMAGFRAAVLFDVPFALQPANLIIDVNAYNALGRDRATGLALQFRHVDEVAGHQFSAAEHTVWEEVSSHAAISTVKGFQLGIAERGQELLVVRNQAEADAAVALCGPAGCADIAKETYCLLTQAWGSSPTWPSPPFACDPAFPDPVDEIRVAKFPVFQFFDWDGYVYYMRQTVGTAAATTFKIVPQNGVALGGGWMVDLDLWLDGSTPFDPAGSSDKCLLDYVNPGDAEIALIRPVACSIDLRSQLFQAGDPVSVIDGNFSLNEPDITIRGRGGFDLRLVRSYNSRSEYLGSLGVGWIHTFDQHLRVRPFNSPDPSDPPSIVYSIDVLGSETPYEEQPGGLIPPTWMHDTLTRETDGSYTLTTKEGFVRSYGPEDADGRAWLQSLQDRNGNAITLQYVGGVLNTVTDTAGRTLQLRYDSTGNLSEVEDWAGRIWRYVVDYKGDLVEYWNPVEVSKEALEPGSGRPRVYEYYAGMSNPALEHNLRRWIRPADRDEDGEGDVWMEFAYYETDRVFSHTNSLGEETTFAYNYFRRRTTVTHPDGATESHLFDQFGNVIRHESPGGLVSDYEYDTDRNRTLEVDALGFETQAVHDGLGNITSRTDRLQKAEIWVYNQFSQPTSYTDRRGNTREWIYDAAGNLEEQRADIGGAREVLQENQYDGFGNLEKSTAYAESGRRGAETTRFEYDPIGLSVIRITDALGFDTRTSVDDLGRPFRQERDRTISGRSFPEVVSVEVVYDELDRVVRETDPVGTTIETDYDANGQIAERRTLVKMPSGEESLFRTDGRNAYDAFDRLVSQTNALGETTSFSYDARGRLIGSLTPLGHESQLRYDPEGNVVELVDPAKAVTTREYDAENRLVREVDPLDRETLLEYDEEGRRKRLVAPGGRVVDEVLEFDEAGNRLRWRDPGGREYRNSFDELGRVLSTEGPIATSEESRTTFTYDLRGRMLSRTRGAGYPEERTTLIGYDALGRVRQVTDPLERSSFRSYDEVGNLVASVNGAGEQASYKWDSRGLLLERSATAVDDRYAYDRLGRVIVERNATATLSRKYDPLDRVVSEYDPRFGTHRMSYDADGRLAQVVYPDGPALGFPAGLVATYQHDARGLMTSVTDATAGTWHRNYDAAGRLVHESHPSGPERTISYTPEGFVDRIEFVDSGSPIESFQYSLYDAAGNPHEIDRSSEAGTTQIDYDAADRVKDITYPSLETETFQYDRVGNRKLHVDRGGITRKYVTDSGDQLTTILDAMDQPLETFQYDDAGRRVFSFRIGGGSLHSYSYDALDRLRSVTSISGGSTLTSLGYDAGGARYRRDETAQPTAFYSPWLEVRGTATIRLVRGSGIGDVLAEVASADVRVLLSDAGANVVRVASASPADDVRRYEAFGSPLSIENPTPVERGFARRPTEGLTGLIYMRARHYDPATGQFLQVDPMRLDTASVYAYARNNPYRFADPSGRAPATHSIATGAASASPPLAGQSESSGRQINFDPSEPALWHFSTNQININLPTGLAVEEALSLVRQDFATFASFNPGNIARARVDSGIAYFDLRGLKGWGSDFINDDEVAVVLSRPNNVQVAATLGAHQLEGVRIWYASQTGPRQIAISTTAFEQPRGVRNRIAFNVLRASEDQRAVWDTYFRNIDRRYFGGRGQVQPFISVEATDEFINPFVGYVGPR